MTAVVIDALSGREVVAGDEEREATQPLVFYLVQRLGWDPRQIITRPQWRVPRRPSGSRTSGYPVDIAIFDSPEHVGDPDHIRIIVECKSPSSDDGVDQLKTYLGLEPEARLGIWFNGTAHLLVYKAADGFLVDEFAPIPRPSDPQTITAGERPLRFRDLSPPPNLGEIFRRLRDQIAAQDTHVNRDEFILHDLANLLICKIADEQAGELNPDRPMAFQLSATRERTGEAIRNLFQDTRNRLRSVFTDDEDRIHVDDSSLENVVRTLQGYRLLGHDRHAVGQAFQVLRGRALKGEEGAYFTPPALVDCVVSITDPDNQTKLIDPACGTGGFLAAALDHVFEKISALPGKVSEDRKAVARRQWAQESLFAIDKDAVSGRLCKAYLTLLGDGRSHVYRANTIDRSEWTRRPDDLAQVVNPGGFDLVLTNPPFGSKLTVAAEVGQHEGLDTCRKWKWRDSRWQPTDQPSSQQIGITFFERCMDLLREGGQLAIVLPETFLFSTTFRWFVDWLCRSFTITHIVDVPMVAFEEFCRAKTCLLFAVKRAPSRGHQIVMSYPRSIGQDRKGRLLWEVDECGDSTGELDNEMAEAVKEIMAATYRGRGGRRRMAAESRLRFLVPQSTALKKGVLVPRYYWRQPTIESLEKWTGEHPSNLVTLGELVDEGVLSGFAGHGSPPTTVRGRGDVPYVKVTDLKNWRINENPTNFVPEQVASRYRRRGPDLQFGDLVSPARASSNIGQFSMVLPWQTRVILTREVLVLRVEENDQEVDAFLLLALLSLRVVQRQYAYLTLMQTNREDLSDRWLEVQVPLPRTRPQRRKLAAPVRDYFQAIVQARESYEEMLKQLGSDDLAVRP